MALISLPGFTSRIDVAVGDELYVGNGEGILTNGGSAVTLSGDNGVIIDGTVVSGKYAIKAVADAEHVGIEVGDGGVIRGFKNGILSRSEEFELINKGQIFGGVKIKADEDDELFAGVFNTGSITGGASLGVASNVEIEIVNFGEILGDIRMSAFDDVYFGGADSVVGEVRGGKGDDFYILNSLFAEVIENKNGGTDTVQVDHDYEIPRNVEKLWLVGDDDLTGTGNGADNIIRGNAGDNSLYGGAGDDRLNGRGGDDVIYGNQGDDRLNGKQGNDDLRGDQGDDIVNGRNGDDKLSGGRGNDDLNGGKGDDVMNGGGAADLLLGKGGDDVLIGGSGVDVIMGGAGNDIIRGGVGIDVLTGGAGEDTFVYIRQNESDRLPDGITDFKSGTDALDFSGMGIRFEEVEIDGGRKGYWWLGPSIGTKVDGDDTLVFVDTDGDGKRDDMLIVLLDTVDVLANDFII